MRVAVSGASGFVGRHVLRELQHRDVDVVVLGRNAGAFAAHPRCVHHAMDLESPSTDDFQRMGRPDVLIHLAWGGLPNFKNPRHVEVELPLHRVWLEGLLREGLGRLCVTGTCLEYGMLEGQQDEDTPPKPTVAYAQAKVQLLDHLRALQVELKFSLTWARLYYVYGPGQATSSLYSQLRACTEGGARVFPMSPADQVRDFVPIELAARIIVDLALAGGNPGVVNVCSGKGISVEQMARQWLAAWNMHIELDKGVYPYPDYEPFAFWGNADKLQGLTGAGHS